MNKRKAASVLTGMALASGAASATTYAVRELPVAPDQLNMEFRTMNNLGHVVWMVVNGGDGMFAGNEFWSPETGYISVHRPNGGSMGVAGLNDRDQIVGSDEYGRIGAVWTPDSYFELPVPAGFQLFLPHDINDAGLVVGQALSANSTRFAAAHASRHDGVVVDERPQSNATLVNAGGDVVLYRYDSACQVNCLPTESLIASHGAVIRVTLPDGSAPYVTAMNDLRELEVEAFSGGLRGYWSQATGFVQVGGTGDRLGNGISNAGEIIGQTPGEHPGESDAFVWTRAAGIQLLKDLVPPDRVALGGNFIPWTITTNGLIGGPNWTAGAVILVPQR